MATADAGKGRIELLEWSSESDIQKSKMEVASAKPPFYRFRLVKPYFFGIV